MHWSERVEKIEHGCITLDKRERLQAVEIQLSSIGISQHILSVDDNIIGVSIFSQNFNLVESASKSDFAKRFTLSEQTEDASPAYAAAMFGMARMVEAAFGRVEKLTVDYQGAKLMLLSLKNARGFVGMVLNKSVNAEYLAAKVLALLEETDEELNTLA